ncbi:MAG: TolC family protein [Bacteroidetes bacterium]|nr:TolC family protein [Bacteroidota bacterium]
MKKILLLFLIVSFCYHAEAQKKWTLEECIKYALENNIQVKQSQLNAESDKITTVQNKLGMLPNLNGSVSHNYNWGRNIDPSSNTYTDQQTQSNSFALTSSVDLFNGFQKLNTIKQSQNNYIASRYDVEKMKNDIALRIGQAYLQILFNKEQVDICQNQVDMSNQQIERTKKLFEAGTIAKGNLLEIQAQGALEESNLVAAQNQLELSYLDLTQLLDLKSTDDFDIVKPEIKVLGDITLVPSNQVFAYAQGLMPEIKSAEFRLESSYNGLAIARSQRYPSLSLSGYFGSNYADNYPDYTKIKSFSVFENVPTNYTVAGTGAPIVQKITSYEFERMSFKDQLNNNLNKSLRFTLSIPIFNGYQVNSNVSKAKLNTLNASYNLQLQKNQLQKSIEQASADAQGAYKSYTASQKAVSSFQESFNYTQQKFDVGMMNGVDYNDAKNKLIKAQSDLLRAKYNFIFKKVILDFYQGNPITLSK